MQLRTFALLALLSVVLVIAVGCASLPIGDMLGSRGVGATETPPVSPLPTPTGPVSPLPSPTPIVGGFYTVQYGDTLAKIAVKLGVTLRALLDANPQIINADRIYVGQKIKIPATAPVPTVAPTPAG